MIFFRVNAVPIAQPRSRARGVMIGGKVRARVWKDEKHPVHAFRDEVAIAGRQACLGADLLDCPLSLSVVIVMPRPGRIPKRLPGRVWCTTRPDSSNILKGIEDALNGIIWKDDSCICRHVVTRYYAAVDESPCVEITVEVLT